MEKRPKIVKVIEIFEDKSSGHQWFQIHEKDPQFRIDRIVYRERSREGWFKEISSEDYLRKVTSLQQRVS